MLRLRGLGNFLEAIFGESGEWGRGGVRAGDLKEVWSISTLLPSGIEVYI